MLYQLEVGVGATRFGIKRAVFSMGAGGTVESSVNFEMEGGMYPSSRDLIRERVAGYLFGDRLVCLSLVYHLG